MNSRKVNILPPQQSMMRMLGDIHGDDLQRRGRRRRRRNRTPGENNVRLRFI